MLACIRVSSEPAKEKRGNKEKGRVAVSHKGPPIMPTLHAILIVILIAIVILIPYPNGITITSKIKMMSR